MLETESPASTRNSLSSWKKQFGRAERCERCHEVDAPPSFCLTQRQFSSRNRAERGRMTQGLAREALVRGSCKGSGQSLRGSRYDHHRFRPQRRPGRHGAPRRGRGDPDPRAYRRDRQRFRRRCPEGGPDLRHRLRQDAQRGLDGGDHPRGDPAPGPLSGWRQRHPHSTRQQLCDQHGRRGGPGGRLQRAGAVLPDHQRRLQGGHPAAAGGQMAR